MKGKTHEYRSISQTYYKKMFLLVGLGLHTAGMPYLKDYSSGVSFSDTAKSIAEHISWDFDDCQDKLNFHKIYNMYDYFSYFLPPYDPTNKTPELMKKNNVFIEVAYNKVIVYNEFMVNIWLEDAETGEYLCGEL